VPKIEYLKISEMLQYLLDVLLQMQPLLIYGARTLQMRRKELCIFHQIMLSSTGSISFSIATKAS
jgi:hypothetical protein